LSIEVDRETAVPVVDERVIDACLLGQGYGLAAVVELLCTALLGMAFGHHTVQMYGPSTYAYP
jgi:LDH2 family malate/lactate/ureidoglycolate dehydrogenase